MPKHTTCLNDENGRLWTNTTIGTLPRRQKMKFSLCTSILLVAPAAAFSILRKPPLIISQALRNSSILTISTTNSTKTHRLGEWPDLPFRVQIGTHLSLNIDGYGRAANIPRPSTLILDSIDNIIYNLDSAGRPYDIIGQLALFSYNGLVKVAFGSEEPEQKFTRLDASEVLEAVRELTERFEPREILMADIEDSTEYKLLSLFTLQFPGPVKVKSTAKG